MRLKSLIDIFSQRINTVYFISLVWDHFCVYLPIEFEIFAHICLKFWVLSGKPEFLFIIIIILASHFHYNQLYNPFEMISMYILN